MITISGGEWSGRRLKVSRQDTLRPSSSRVKAAIFSIIESIQWKRTGSPDFSSWNCLDLFAGVGGLGLEMLSRGAAKCTFVEKDRQSVKILRENIATLQCQERATVIAAAVEDLQWLSAKPFDLVLIDPPYAGSDLPELLLQLVEALSPGALIVFEHDPKVRQQVPPGIELHSERKLGPAGISVFIRPQG